MEPQQRRWTKTRSAKADLTDRGQSARRVRFGGPIMFRCAAAVLALALSLASLGCLPPKQVQPAGYFGPTETMAEVVNQINQNNRNIPSLWSRHDFEADIVDENGRRHFVNGDGLLLYRKPFEMRLIGEKPVVGTVFEIGSTEERYWLIIPEQLQTMWWGYYRNIGKPCAGEIPIRPELILEVLGVSDIGTDFMAQPAPIMRFNNDADAYMFVWVIEGRDRLIAVREVWYDRQTKLPKLVLLFDDNGRILLRAYLSEHQRIPVEDLPEDQQPMIATRYQLFFPDSGSKMQFRLREPVLSRRGFPKDVSFQFPTRPGVPPDRIIQVDEHCRD